MHGPAALVILGMMLAASVGFDLARTLRTGRAHGKFGTITRKSQPERFRRYVLGDWLVLGLSILMISYATIEMLQP